MSEYGELLARLEIKFKGRGEREMRVLSLLSRFSRRPKILLVVSVSALLLGSVVAGPASAASSSVPSYVPKSVAQIYPGWQYFSKMQKDPDASYKPPASGKASFCYSTTYEGNAFQEGAISELTKLANEASASGIGTGKLTVTDSNNSASLQLSQINSLVNSGCKVIFSFPASPTGLCSAVNKAVQHGDLFVTVESPVYCPNAINVTWNGYQPEYTGALAVMKAMGGKGNLVVTTGIPGVAIGTAETFAVKDALKKYPNVKVLGDVDGEWTSSVTKTAMSSFLASHPQPVNGIIDAGDSDLAAEQALISVGRKPVPVNSITGECGILAFWKQYPQTLAYGTDQDPVAASYEAFLAAEHMLAGQKPVVNNMFYPVPTITKSNFSSWYKPNMTTSSGCIPESPGGRAVADSWFNAFFKGGSKHIKTVKP
jgi:ribose transport system substrate-binding protein